MARFQLFGIKPDFSVYDSAGNKWIDFTSTILLPMLDTQMHVLAAIKSCIDSEL